jgi:hypothetical protein
MGEQSVRLKQITNNFILEPYITSYEIEQLAQTLSSFPASPSSDRDASARSFLAIKSFSRTLMASAIWALFFS